MSTSDPLSREFLRPPAPGLRVFSVGLLQLMRLQQLALAGGETSVRSEEEQRLELVAACYLFDARHSLDQIRAVALLPRERFFEIVRDYEFTLEPGLLMRVKAEIARTNEAVAAAAYDIEPRPGDPKGPEPRGK